MHGLVCDVQFIWKAQLDFVWEVTAAMIKATTRTERKGTKYEKVNGATTRIRKKIKERNRNSNRKAVTASFRSVLFFSIVFLRQLLVIFVGPGSATDTDGDDDAYGNNGQHCHYNM